ncbi:tRNA uridine-5-carboxymethylaminomethyl(34) synthesis GTPase MnmE [soil metagenome]
MTDTIFALASGQPPAAIGVVRISGPGAASALATLAGRVPAPRRASLALLADPDDGAPLDRALLLWFPGPATATGEDLAELHCHGGRAVTAAVLAALSRIAGLRAAAPGEFTRRAFENGRIDLSEAEGLADLLMAETESQRRSAMAMAEGHFSRRIAGWESALLRVSAAVEAELDFSDEDDVPGEGMEARIVADITALAADVRGELRRPSAERLRDGIRVVLAGPPNAGKSTLLNALAGRDAAIVSAVAGTTRDRIEVPVALDGIAFLLTDTAGLRDGGDAVEAIGIERAQEAIAAADILLWLGSPGNAPRADALCITAQMDRPGWVLPAGTVIALSAVTGQGMTELHAQLQDRARVLVPREGDYALHARQRAMVAVLADALDGAAAETDLLVVAEQLRLGRMAIDGLTGRAGTEAMLDALFGQFCIGK